MGITALGIGLPDLDKRVVQRLAFAVKNAANDADARTGRAVVSYGRASDGAEIVAVLLGCEAEGEEGTNRLRRSLPKGHGSGFHRRGPAAAQHDVEVVAEGEAAFGGIEREGRDEAVTRAVRRGLEDGVEGY